MKSCLARALPHTTPRSLPPPTRLVTQMLKRIKQIILRNHSDPLNSSKIFFRNHRKNKWELVRIWDWIKKRLDLIKFIRKQKKTTKTSILRVLYSKHLSLNGCLPHLPWPPRIDREVLISQVHATLIPGFNCRHALMTLSDFCTVIVDKLKLSHYF